MSHWRRALCLTVACGAALSSGRADQAQTPAIPKPRAVSIEAYSGDNPSCLEWTDGCTICAKIDADTPACSTPGIACQPAGIQCKKSAK